MRQVIYKYPIEITDEQVVMMPEGADIISCQMQYDTPKLWALVNPSATPEPRTIHIFGTGHPIAAVPRAFIGTIQKLDGNLVFHVFEEVK